MPDTRWTMTDVDTYLRESGRALAPGSMALAPLVTDVAIPGSRVLGAVEVTDPTPRAPQRKHGLYWPYKSRAEARYAQLLDTLKYEDQVVQWWYEPMKGLYLAPDTTYTPDFLVQWRQGPRSTELEMHEVKGPYIREKDWIKVKHAAAKYTCFRWVLAQWKQGTWLYKDIPRY